MKKYLLSIYCVLNTTNNYSRTLEKQEKVIPS